MQAYPNQTRQGNATRIGRHLRLPVTEFGQLVAYVYWPEDAPERWSTGVPYVSLGFDAWACPEDGPLLVTRTPADWVRRPESWCPLTRDAKRIGLDLLAVGRLLAFESASDLAWARGCINSVILPKCPRLLVERPKAIAA